MGKGKKIVCSLAAAALIGCGAWFAVTHVHVGFHFYPKKAEFLDVREVSTEEYEALRGMLPDCELLWDVPAAGQRLPMDSREIAVSFLSDGDVRQLDYLAQLETVNAISCTDYDQLLALQKRRPELRVDYAVNVGGMQILSGDTEAVFADADAGELAEKLALLPGLGEVRLEGKLPEAADLMKLREQYPEKEFSWTVELGGMCLPWDTTVATLSGVPYVSGGEIGEKMAYLPELRQLDLLGSGLSNEELMALADQYPDCFFVGYLDIFEQTVATDVKELDISGVELESVEQVEAMLPYFHRLKRVIMCKCGIDDETMDALNRKYEDIRFVWSVKIKGYDIRTDTKYFYPFKLKKDLIVDNEDIYPLRYCTDIEAIDIGHMTLVENCDWAAFMPNLKYLVIIETRITDLTPLSNLKNLVFLEIFTTNITDYSPLIGCTALEDLNLGKTYGDPTPLTQMTWLKNVWWGGVVGTYGLPCSKVHEILPEALPNTRFKFYMDSPNVDNGWRQLDNYYRMRDTMDVFYLT